MASLLVTFYCARQRAPRAQSAKHPEDEEGGTGICPLPLGGIRGPPNPYARKDKILESAVTAAAKVTRCAKVDCKIKAANSAREPLMRSILWERRQGSPVPFGHGVAEGGDNLGKKTESISRNRSLHRS